MNLLDNLGSLKSNLTSPETKQNKTIKFIHASDLHLGSHQYEKSHRSDDFILALQEILTIAYENFVDFILFGGDVFNSLDILPGKMDAIIEVLQEFKKVTNGKILIIAIEGNHDIRRYSHGVKFCHRNQSWLKVCANLGLLVLLDADIRATSDQIFQPYDFEQGKGGKIQIKNITIYGTRYLGERPISQLSKIRKAIKKEKGIYTVLLQHFGVEGQMKQVPGVSLDLLKPLHHRIDYLALGHFHKQFVIDDWIYNPGSAEAVCSMDFCFKRGIFLVEISGIDYFTKKVTMIPLRNRKAIWRSIIIPCPFKNKNQFYAYIVKRLKETSEWKQSGMESPDKSFSYLFLTLRGMNPFVNQKFNSKELQNILNEQLPIIGARIYLKFESKSITLENYL